MNVNLHRVTPNIIMTIAQKRGEGGVLQCEPKLISERLQYILSEITKPTLKGGLYTKVLLI